MVFEVTRLWLHSMTYPRKDKYKSGHSIWKILGRYKWEAKVIIFKGNQIVEETILLDKIQRNNTREQEVQKKLERGEGQVWKDNRVVYIEERIYVPNNQKIW